VTPGSSAYREPEQAKPQRKLLRLGIKVTQRGGDPHVEVKITYAPPTIGEVLEDCGYQPPHLYFRAVAAAASSCRGTTAMLVWVLFSCVTAFFMAGLPGLAELQPTYQYTAYSMVQRLVGWWDNSLDTPQSPDRPPSFRTATRCRKKGRGPYWDIRLYHAWKAGQRMTGSLKRLFKRYSAAVEPWLHSKQRAARAQAATTWSIRLTGHSVIPALLLIVTCLIAVATASPDAVNINAHLTNNLAAWELSQLAGWRFR
jgi:hypothetical protein